MDGTNKQVSKQTHTYPPPCNMCVIIIPLLLVRKNGLNEGSNKPHHTFSPPCNMTCVIIIPPLHVSQGAVTKQKAAWHPGIHWRWQLASFHFVNLADFCVNVVYQKAVPAASEAASQTEWISFCVSCRLFLVDEVSRRFAMSCLLLFWIGWTGIQNGIPLFGHLFLIR